MSLDPADPSLELAPTMAHPGLAEARTEQVALASRAPAAVAGLRSPSTPVGTSGASVATPEAALARDELDRTRIFMRLTLVLALGALVPLQFLGGDPIAKRVVVASSLVLFVAGAWMLWILEAPETRYAEWKKVLVGLCCGACGCAGVYYWGIFSSASLVLGFGVYFVSPQGTFVSGLLVYGQCALFQLGLSVAVYTGVLADRGVLRPAPFGVADFVVLEVAVQAVLLASFAFARASRTTALRAIGDLERTVREAARREALLLEARQDLARALRVGGPGRYTDQTLGSFSLGALLGQGGMGEVYEARHVETGAIAAVKMPHRHLLVDADQVARFVREANAVARLHSPHVVRVLEVSDPGAPVPYLAMERLVGRDLAELLRDRPKLDPSDVRDLVEQVARGITAAHRAGIVHRDLKPQNVFRSEAAGESVWKVLDFGLSKLADQTGNLTRGQVLGTPAYMAPEQASSKEIDGRADVYALAAIAYRALTGQPPFHGTDMMALLLEVVSRMPVRPRLLSRAISDDVERVLLVGLAKNPSDRFATPTEFATALASALVGKIDPATNARAAYLLAAHPWSALPEVK